MHYINKNSLPMRNKFMKKLYLFYVFSKKSKANKITHKRKNLKNK